MKPTCFVIFSLFLLISCSENNLDEGQYLRPLDLVIEGQWKIQETEGSGNSSEFQLTGFVLEFNDDAVVTATKGDYGLIGTWHLHDQEAPVGTRDSGRVLELDFPDLNDAGRSVFISNSWTVISYSSDTIVCVSNADQNYFTDTLVLKRVNGAF